MTTFTLTLSKRGIPCMWEHGGGYSNTGEAQVITDHKGLPLHPIYIRRSGQLACSEHALIPVYEGCCVVGASHHRGDFEITCHELTGDRYEQNGHWHWNARLVCEFSRGEWDNPNGPDDLAAAVKAAKDKATCYHCREPHYVI